MSRRNDASLLANAMNHFTKVQSEVKNDAGVVVQSFVAEEVMDNEAMFPRIVVGETKADCQFGGY